MTLGSSDGVCEPVCCSGLEQEFSYAAPGAQEDGHKTNCFALEEQKDLRAPGLSPVSEGLQLPV